MLLVPHSSTLNAGTSPVPAAVPTNPIVEAQVNERLQELMPSPARQRYQELVKQKQSRIEKIELDTGDWFIRRMNFPEFTRFGLLTPRDEKGHLDLVDAENLTGLTAAMLYCCVTADENGMVDFFTSLGEAYEWASETDKTIRDTVGHLFNAILARNPDIIPDGEEQPTAEQQDAVKKKPRAPRKTRARKNAA